MIREILQKDGETSFKGLSQPAIVLIRLLFVFCQLKLLNKGCWSMITCGHDDDITTGTDMFGVVTCVSTI